MQSLANYQIIIEQQLESYLAQLPSYATNLDQAIRYASLQQGKRMRPALVLAIGEALGIEMTKLAAPACALELIHCYSLVHDDLPAMDNDELRRGKPTCHIAFNEATAILVGDAQQTLAFDILSHATEIPAEPRLLMLQLLSKAAGVFGMVSGQQIDMNSEGKLTTPLNLAELSQLHQLKTGALLKTALLLGACQAENFAQIRPILEDIGEKIGLAFQVQDDILDIEADSSTLGKTQGKDEAADKSTFPKLLGLEEAKTYRDQLIHSAQQKRNELPFNSEFLKDLIDYIAQRAH